MKNSIKQNKPASAGQLKNFGVMVANIARKLGMNNRQLQGCILSGPIVKEVLTKTLTELCENPEIANAAIKKPQTRGVGLRFTQCHVYEIS